MSCHVAIAKRAILMVHVIKQFLLQTFKIAFSIKILFLHKLPIHIIYPLEVPLQFHFIKVTSTFLMQKITIM